MTDYQRVIEFLRDVRQGAGSSGLQSLTDEIAHMAAEYATLCASANERLRKCTSFLQQGLRSEAIHVAEESPNLLDLVAQLDLPDPQSWAEFCQNNSLPVPPTLQMERAAQLNEAYAQEQPMEHLLARHRLLALSRAPVRERLDVMRKIAQMDPGNAHWEKDIRIFEQARLKELPSVFYNAIKNHDNHAIMGLMEELNGQPWFESPPAEFLTAVTEASGRVQRAGVEAELRKLVEPLREAYAARSLQECQALVQRWKNVMASAGVAHIAGELLDEIRPVVAFISEQTKHDEYMKRFTESCKTFAKLLDAGVPDTQLEAGYAKLREFKAPIPEDLTQRYMSQRQGRRKDADRKHKQRLLVIAGVFAAVIIIGVVVALLLMRSTNADKWARQINAAVAAHTEEGLKEAQKHVDSLQASNPALLKEPAVSKAVSALQVAQQKFADDMTNLREASAKLEKSHLAASQVLANAGAAMEEIRTGAESLDQVLTAVSLMLKDREWADTDGKLQAAITLARNLRQRLQERVLNIAHADLKVITTALDALPQSPSTPAAALQVQNQLTLLAERTDKLKTLPLLDAATKTQIESLAERIIKRRQSATVTGNMAEELQNVRTKTDSAGDLRTALTGFINRFPNDARTANFKTALERLPAGETLEAWQAKLSEYKGLAPASASEAQKRAEEITSFLAVHPEFPRTAEGIQYVEYLKRAADTLGDRSQWQSAFEPWLKIDLLKDLCVIEVSDGRRYYTLGEPKRMEHKLNDKISISFEALDPNDFQKSITAGAVEAADAKKRIQITIDPPQTASETPLPVPHAKVITDIGDTLKNIDDKNWDTYGIDLADKLKLNDQMNVVVKAILLQIALKAELTVTGDMLGDTYARTMDSLVRQKAEEHPWAALLDPTKITDGSRKSLKTTMDEMPAAASVKQRLAAAKTALFKSVLSPGMASGVLLKDDAGAWGVYSQATPVNGAEAWAIVPAPTPVVPATAAATPMKLTLVGTYKDGKYVFDATALRNVPQGNIVYITRP